MGSSPGQACTPARQQRYDPRVRVGYASTVAGERCYKLARGIIASDEHTAMALLWRARRVACGDGHRATCAMRRGIEALDATRMRQRCLIDALSSVFGSRFDGDHEPSLRRKTLPMNRVIPGVLQAGSPPFGPTRDGVANSDGHPRSYVKLPRTGCSVLRLSVVGILDVGLWCFVSFFAMPELVMR